MRSANRNVVHDVDAGVQILVHVSAGSSARNDARYQAEAQAYLSFEPTGRIFSNVIDDDGGMSELEEDEVRHHQIRQSLVSQSFTSQDAQDLLDFAERKAQEIDHELGSRRNIRIQEMKDDLKCDVGDWLSLASSSSSASSCLSIVQQVLIPSTKRPQSVEEMPTGRSRKRSIRSDPRTSQNMSTLSLSQTMDEEVDGEKENVLPGDYHCNDDDDDDEDDGLSLSYVPQSLGDDKCSPINDQLHITIPSGADHRSFVQPQPTPQTLPSHEPSANTTFEIHPPLPLTSASASAARPTLSTIQTPSLTLLAQTLSLPKRFQPILQTRPLRQFERGHWTFSITDPSSAVSSSSSSLSFPPDLRIRFWSFLREFIESGKAGWGVWICTSAMSSTRDGQQHQQEGRGQAVEVYCWGGVVGHVYLLLWLASERRIVGRRKRMYSTEGVRGCVGNDRDGHSTNGDDKNTAILKWIDGAGNVVVGI